MTIRIPKPALVLLIGISGSGKSSFAAKHFKPTEVISSDRCRALIADDQTDQTVSKEAFALVRFLTEKRLGAGKLAVIDATNVLDWGRAGLLEIAQKQSVPTIALVLDLPLELCLLRNSQRERSVPPKVIEKQAADLRITLEQLEVEGHQAIYRLQTSQEMEECSIRVSPPHS